MIQLKHFKSPKNHFPLQWKCAARGAPEAREGGGKGAGP